MIVRDYKWRMCIIFFEYVQTFADRACFGSRRKAEQTRAAADVSRRDRGSEGRRSMAVSDLSQMTLAEMPAYTEQDTKVEKKAHYAQIVEKFRNADCSHIQDLVYLIDTIQQVSPEIYEHYRGLQDIFRANIHRLLEEIREPGEIYRVKNEEEKQQLTYCLEQACANKTLLREKYQNLHIEI